MGAVASTIVVSCSNTKVPQISNATTYKVGSNTFERTSSGNLECKAGYNGTDYKTSPGFDSSDPNSEKNLITNQFTAINYGLSHIQQLGESILTIIQNLYSSKIYESVLGLNFSSVEAIAKFSYEGEAGGVRRAGLKSIEITSANVDTLTDPGTSKDPKPITFTGITFTYAKWYSSNGSNVKWEGDLGTLELSPLTLNMNPLFSGDKWNGQYSVESDEKKIKINNNNAEEYFNVLRDLRKAIDGNILNTTLKSYCENNKDKVINTLNIFNIS